LFTFTRLAVGLEAKKSSAFNQTLRPVFCPEKQNFGFPAPTEKFRTASTTLIVQKVYNRKKVKIKKIFGHQKTLAFANLNLPDFYGAI